MFRSEVDVRTIHTTDLPFYRQELATTIAVGIYWKRTLALCRESIVGKVEGREHALITQTKDTSSVSQCRCLTVAEVGTRTKGDEIAGLRGRHETHCSAEQYLARRRATFA